MNSPSQTPALNLPPEYSQIEKHPVFPEASHDENARFNFLSNLNKYVTSALQPGNKVAFEKRVKPQFERLLGHDINTREEVSEALRQDPHYQTWSALRRSTLEMVQQASRSMVLRQINSLAQKAKQYNQQRAETLQLDPALTVPQYLRLVDSHGMPGGYYTEYVPDDVTNAANYDASLFVTKAGDLGKLSDGGGRAIVAWLKQNYPQFSPKRILDLGCGIGHNTLPLAIAYPDAEIIGIDVSAPMLRYGHARAIALGVQNVRFIQADAEKLPFENGTFDWVQSTQFLQETAASALRLIGEEVYRILRPDGAALYMELPQYTVETPLFERFMSDWDALNNNEPFRTAIHNLNVKEWLLSSGFTKENLLQFGVRAVNKSEDFTKPSQQEDYSQSATWSVFGAFKR